VTDDSDGLKSVSMTRLGSVVVLAGPNGGGKTRVLKRVLAGGNRKLSSGEGGLQATLARLGLVVDSPRPEAVHDFSLREVRLHDERNSSKEDVKRAASRIAEAIGIANLAAEATSRVASVQGRWFNATHHETHISDEARNAAVASYEDLKSLILQLVGGVLGRDIDGNPTLFGSPIAARGLSPGQSLLLQLAVVLHAQAKRLDGLVLVLDEPELHLHPSVVVDVLERLREANPSGQIWIATHSLPILAWAEPESLWFVNDGVAKWAGRQPEVVLDGLLGHTVGRERLESFLQLPAQFASANFASECLVPPRAVDTPTTDPQLRQIREALAARAPVGRPMRVLDYGAGKARLLAALAEAAGPEVTNRIDYRAFDQPGADSAVRAELVNAVYGDGAAARRCFESDDDLRTTLNAGSVDVVVLCNVLHEIPPEDWAGVLGANATVTRLLRPDGFLLVVEDQHIPVGEKAHRQGFLLLGEPHLRVLFGCTESSQQIIKSSEPGGRLEAYAIPASLLPLCTHDATVGALGLLERTARDKICRLREAEPTYRNGQLHGLWTQLFANATLALAKLGG
jgi:SAM-dependent methyltransferase/ABC-type cobalamin/Fe3+-siderophores transport system ATPase subunit